MNHLTQQKLRTDCAEFEVLVTGSTGHAGPVESPAGHLSSPLRQKHREGVSLLLLWTAHRILECGDRGMTNIQVVIQVWRWEEGPHTDPEAGKYPWIPQARI